MTRNFAITFLAAVLGFSSTTSHAHHSFAAEFDVNTKISVEGVIVEVRYRNPHVQYFIENSSRSFSDENIEQIKGAVLGAYRWQYIFSGVEHPRFQELIGRLITDVQQKRLSQALAPLAQTS